ncbi:MAG: 4-hydroxy-3-methylbut-2-enyl diphosphate reductase [Thermosynechococcus sp. Uc]|uniref:4-hydroxy-3-methylbut-2-enyl diphosphate reductase n=1 Tax=Thermosynechococcus sp. Uc TaxID=3034853 RepID=UPI0019DF705F|nr:4-hydroxy-3-methylbut-2-enyl diphosphate reductase [Thermosynechococcus sp. Uc]MDM7326900.1 4-hydroxy-3-methylbut-2-enyl diphosphate reductase [Thermosynechococcus sp. Uc]HIK25701.1 4-hydroxy-3-methylbut-2-enyl diphosphate reductase [Thermosynechococcus sp. M46_R2017_013]
MDTRAFKRSLHSSENYHRKGFGHGEAVNQQLQGEYQSSLIQQIRANGYRWQEGDVTIRLAEAFGFCWGVERAVALAYETRTHFPTERIWITNEIIHNPSVNERLRQMAVEFIPVVNGAKDFSEVRQGDVVILPAFGASVQEMQLLNERGCTIVDTTCPWVSKVWHSVEKHKKVSFTSIIHGKYNHEETIATSSFAGTYLIVLNLEEARYVCDYILKGGDREAFMAKFAKACSTGFDPERDLVRVGIANQTTMLKGETEQIGKLFERTMIQKYGPDRLNEHFMSFNTICDATQERQDAMLNLVKEPLDLMVVIGGYNSSNTTHLQEIAIEHGIPSYHIDSADRIGPGNRIQHKPLHQNVTVTENWLPNRPLTIGITSGASTPDKVVEEVLNKIFALRSLAAVS